jgi:hypothetical protein
MADLLLDLHVDGNARGRIGFAKHCINVIAQWISEIKTIIST